ncbi:hypothetical protein IF090_11700 [Acinetobacter towneri]|uniref:hypothetical protein n=1 Tax=Acinetobacter towneri TaxID=202956 RepID=UPI001CE06C42|nr:hypothetical protein [Acinetobacter towneri]MCA4780288.1 hypothetical protein [Acinetobacter towneri]MCA4785654.1 hypothetical protein [Acinetobacter towneri]MCA4787512.1 hypothetical protein [Acinetobacter towneri]MCA4796794.1 hypothetical protein [Acinetobacter towneri]MCA4801841.1 hypothetical protein [Acinetobacter towneri]
MIGTQIKPDYSDKIAEFVKNGGEIKQAVNTNRVDFNFSVSTGGLKQNIPLRKEAEVKGLKTYTPFSPCEKCGTSERSTKTNACLECDRRRARAKTGLSLKNLEAIGHYLLGKGESIEFTSNGQKYVLKVEVAA